MVKIRRIEHWTESFQLSEPYEIAYERLERVDNVFLRLVTDPWTGVGCAAPDLKLTGETASSVTRVLSGVAEPVLTGADGLARGRLLAELEGPLKEHPAALAAVDLALHDLLGKATGLPLWKLLGAYRDRIPTSVTVGILDLDKTVAAARRRVEEGFFCLKLKGGQDVEDDIARVLAVRAAVGEEVELRFDANQGFTLEESVHFVEATRSARLELLEQPTARELPELLGRVTAAVELPVMADESLVSVRDAFRLAGEAQADMVNVKLMKAGGIARAQRIDAVARAARLETMVGCMDESALAIAGALAFALAGPNVHYADLDGHLDLVGDPAAGALPVVAGQLHGPMGPGLGVEVG